MLQIDEAILGINCNICKNIERFDESERGLLSQNILSQLRNLVEYVMQKICSDKDVVDPNDYKDKVDCINRASQNGKLKFLVKFHNMLQKSVSHYTFDENGSERLMLKYYEYLLRIKNYMKEVFNMEILQNLAQFPIDLDDSTQEYYALIIDKINNRKEVSSYINYKDRYYIQKIKSIYVNNKVYYEVTFTIANGKVSKFDRIVAFTNIEITDYYSCRLTIRKDDIDIFGEKMQINIIENWEVSIRACELNNFARIVNYADEIGTDNIEYRNLMKYLTISKNNLIDLILSGDELYIKIKTLILKGAKAIKFLDVIDKCRIIISKNLAGSNILRYLLYKMNNTIIKNQSYSYWQGKKLLCSCEKLSNLKFNFGCIPFDTMPFCSSPIEHNPKLEDLLECIDDTGREHEFLARKVMSNAENDGEIFTAISDVEKFGEINKLILTFNGKVYYKHKFREIALFNDNLYIKKYTHDAYKIVNMLKELSQKGVEGYTASVESWLNCTGYHIDSEEKKAFLLNLFNDSSVALIYGAAGTGKTTMINHISNFFNDKKKMYIAQTNPAVNNIKRKILADNKECMTVNKFKMVERFCDVLFVDESTTISNSDMVNVLEKCHYSLLVLVGDVFQIESINFGNWFTIAREFVSSTSIIELDQQFRTEDENLRLYWKRVRSLDDSILEIEVKACYSEELNQSIFKNIMNDEIILCLNYDGLYGINNINRFLQNGNPNMAYEWAANVYKIGDPILFNDSERFAPLIYNNMKGRICSITKEENSIKFEIELEIAINALDAKNYSFELIGLSEDNKHSIISFYVYENGNSDEDIEKQICIMPFQIAYAVSIHKAQGLEYDSVKIVIAKEMEDRITHNIFYTAITRAKKSLKIYWSPETEQKIFSSFKYKNYTKDIALLRQLYEHKDGKSR